MKIKLITISSELKSAKRLGFKTSVEIDEAIGSDLVIRWGNSSTINYLEFPKVLNSCRAIALNCHKKYALELLKTVVCTPTIFYGKIPFSTKAVLRPLQHTGGQGFSIQDGPFDFSNEFYATEFLSTEEEYRVWFCGDTTFRALRVPLNAKDVADAPCRSNWGYRYCENVPKNLHLQVLKAAKKIGLEFGAADILKYKGSYYFLELNSAPSIDTKTLETFFKTNLALLAKKKYNIEI